MPDRAGVKIKSPEQLDNYISVTSPGVWFVLSAILVLLAGFTFWVFTGEIHTEDNKTIRPISLILNKK